MERVSIASANYYCPQSVFLYGTNKEDGTPNFGTFTWFSYCWDSEMCVMASIGGGKLTIDRIRETKIFSANLVTESILPLADYLGNNPGYISDKMKRPIDLERGAVLDVPVIKNSPWVYELEVKQSVPLDGNEIFICRIRNVLVDKELTDPSKSPQDCVKNISPVIWFGAGPYFRVYPEPLGNAGDWKDLK